MEFGMEKPTFMLFPGAFHSAAHLHKLTARLEAVGYPTYAYTLKSVGDLTVPFEAEVNHIRDSILDHVGAGKEVVLAVHSLAGVPATQAIHGLGKKEREHKKLSGGLLGVVFVTALVPTEGMSGYKIINSNWLPWMVPDVSKADN
jgi:hypothetical protein